jgi:membrane protein DedA with SNARE-associated domain
MRWLANLLLLLTAHGMPLAALISVQTLENILSVVGYPAVTLFVMIESSGIPFPGETMLLVASFFAATDPGLHLSIPIVIACAALGAIVGDNLGYLAGRTGGRALVLRFGKYIFLKPEHLDYAERFFEKHGDKTVFFGRFIAVLRAWAAFLAGINHMRWRRFLIYNAAGGILWATIYGTLGFIAGRFFHDNFATVERIARDIGLIGAVIIVAFAVAAFILLRLRRRKRMLAAIAREAAADAPDEEERAIQQQNSAELAPANGEPAPGSVENAQGGIEREPDPEPDSAGSIQK